MTQNKVLENMFTSLSEALSENEKSAFLTANYEHQCALYERLIDMSESENDLVCGRCLIALSRSLAAEKIPKESVTAAKNELRILKPLFSKTAHLSKKQIEKLVRSRIESLTSASSDEVIDAFLFLYLSLR